ncbi:hypothetical protein C0J52_13972 [Blattella germanica]|nr:hypothetical protein C0J52_13972 [Blattella germanica]
MMVDVQPIRDQPLICPHLSPGVHVSDLGAKSFLTAINLLKTWREQEQQFVDLSSSYSSLSTPRRTHRLPKSIRDPNIFPLQAR